MKSEATSGFVNDLIEEVDVPKFVHSTNLCEHFARRGDWKNKAAMEKARRKWNSKLFIKASPS